MPGLPFTTVLGCSLFVISIAFFLDGSSVLRSKLSRLCCGTVVSLPLHYLGCSAGYGVCFLYNCKCKISVQQAVPCCVSPHLSTFGQPFDLPSVKVLQAQPSWCCCFALSLHKPCCCGAAAAAARLCTSASWLLLACGLTCWTGWPTGCC